MAACYRVEMSETVNLPDKLPLDARTSREPLEQSIARQPDPLSACLEAIDTPAGRERLQAVLAQQPYPHFQADQTFFSASRPTAPGPSASSSIGSSAPPQHKSRSLPKTLPGAD